MEETKEAAPPTQPQQQDTKGDLTRFLEQVRSGELSVEEGARKIGLASAGIAAGMLALANGPVIARAKPGSAPRWAKVPQDLKIPDGRQVVYLRFPSQWTDRPKHGFAIGELSPAGEDLWRQCICWSLTDTEEIMAYKRAMGDGVRARGELAKQMIRVIDGMQADWGTSSTEPSSVDGFWTQIGAKCRSLTERIYTQLHQLSPAEQVAFFESCVESRFGA